MLHDLIISPNAYWSVDVFRIRILNHLYPQIFGNPRIRIICIHGFFEIRGFGLSVFLDLKTTDLRITQITQI